MPPFRERDETVSVEVTAVLPCIVDTARLEGVTRERSRLFPKRVENAQVDILRMFPVRLEKKLDVPVTDVAVAVEA